MAASTGGSPPPPAGADLGLPRPGAPPLLLDFATSLVAEGKVLVASLGGKPIPGDALISPDGTKSNDPAVL